MRVFKYMENNSEMRDVAFGRLDCYADADVPQKIIENISNVVELNAVPKKLSDYSEAEIESFSRFVHCISLNRQFSFSQSLPRTGRTKRLLDFERQRTLSISKITT